MESQAELAKEIAYRMEVKKDALRQTQNGDVKVTFTIHPQDMNMKLYQDPMGQRYVMVIVPIDDNDSPLPPLENSGPDCSNAVVPPATTNEAGRESRKWGDMQLSQRAALLTKDHEFLRFYGLPSEEAADRMIKSECEILSKAELDLPDTEELIHKKDIFRGLEKKFLDWRQEQRITQGRDYL